MREIAFSIFAWLWYSFYMSTVRQKVVARNLVENMRSPKPKNKKEILVLSGYSNSIASKNADSILESPGVKAEVKVLGFDDISAMKVVQKIMHDNRVDPSARLKATDQVFKVQGTYAPEKQAIVHAFVLPDEEKKRLDDILNDNE